MEISLRITSDTITPATLGLHLDPISDKYIIAEEYATRRHLQCYVKLNYVETNRFDKLRYRITKEFPELTGNKSLSITQKRTDNLKIYVMKECGDKTTKGFTESELENLKSLSYVQAYTYTQAKKELEKRFLTKNVSIRTLSLEYMKIHHKYDIDYDIRKIDMYIQRLINIKKPKSMEIIADNFQKKYSAQANKEDGLSAEAIWLSKEIQKLQKALVQKDR